MRTLSGVVPAPPGALSASPFWEQIYTPLDTITGLYRIIDDDLRIFISCHEDHGFTDMKVLSKGNEANAAPAIEFDQLLKDPYITTKPAYFSSVGSHVFVGDGVADNAAFLDGEGFLTNPLPLDTSRYSEHSHPFPPCKVFVRSADLSLFASGNDDHPLRVWVSEPLDVMNKESFGLATEDMSYVDIICEGATRVTGLSTFRNTVVCHTDGGVVLLKKPELLQAKTGWRVEQVNTDVRAGASSLRTLNPSAGSLPYYLGSDGQLYRNEFRGSTDTQLAPQAETTATWGAVGVWDQTIKDVENAFMTYNPSENWVVLGVNADHQVSQKGHPIYLIRGRLFADTREEQPEVISGPHFFPRFVCVESVPRSSHLIGLDAEGRLWTTDLRKLRDEKALIPFDIDYGESSPRVYIHNDPTAEAAVLAVGEQPVGTGNNEMIQVSADFNIAFEDRLSGTGHSFMHPMGARLDGMLPDTDENWSDNRLLSVAETVFDDLNRPEVTKQFLEVILTFAPGSVGHVGLFVETDEGKYDGRWHGNIEGTDSLKAFVNVRGRKIRLRLYVVAEPGATWTVNDVTVGYLPQQVV
jgi:hypothetical protein